MRPTFSIIAFTVLSGAGYGLWLLLGLGLLAGQPSCGAATTPDDSLAVTSCVSAGIIGLALLAGFVLVSVGLLSSVAHLGQPTRAWRALSQWRSSWLSREGVAALLTYIPVVLIGASMLVGSRSRVGTLEQWLLPSVALRPLGAGLAAGALVTLFCTANIYASLKPVRAWSNRWVTPGYFLLGIYSGALLLASISTFPYARIRGGQPLLLAGIAVLAAVCAALKYSYWRDIDRLPPLGTGRATGLETLGTVHSFEQPHTEENYLTREMGFVLARRHAAKLRAIALVSGFVVPASLAILGLAVPVARLAAAWLALFFGVAGIFIERWLFFAEARHAVIAYYRR